MKSMRNLIRLASIFLAGAVIAPSAALAYTNAATTSGPEWIWFGPSRQDIPEKTTYVEFTPLSLVPGFLKPLYGWFEGSKFEGTLLNTNLPGPFTGTVSLTTNEQGDAALAVYEGQLTLNLPDGQKLVINGGEATILNKDNPGASVVQPISELMQTPAYRAMLMEAVSTTATQLAANANDENRAELTRALAAVVQTVSAADPTAAQSIVQTAVNILTEGGKDGTETLQAVATVVAAAANGSKVDQDTLAGYAAETAAQNGATGITVATIKSPTAQGALGNVFNPEDVITPIEVDLVSPDSP